MVSTSPSYTFTATANRTFQANFMRVFTITTSPAPVNGGNTTGDGTYTNNASVTVTATPHFDFVFVDWTEGGTTVSTSSTYTFAATADRALVANFLHGEVITTSANPPNGGTTTGDGTYPWGTTVTVSALTNTGFVFVNWSENGNFLTDLPDYTFTATSTLSLVATFAPAVVITASADPAIGGTISGDGLYAAGQWVGLWASPNPDFAFVNWTANGVIVNTWEYDSFVAETNVTLVAHFTNAVTIVTSSSDPNAGTSGGDGVFPAGATVGVIAAPKSGYAFVNWTENGMPDQHVRRATPSPPPRTGCSWQTSPPTAPASPSTSTPGRRADEPAAHAADADCGRSRGDVQFPCRSGSVRRAKWLGHVEVLRSLSDGQPAQRRPGNPVHPASGRHRARVLHVRLPGRAHPEHPRTDGLCGHTNAPVASASAAGTVNYADSAPVSGWLGFTSATPFNLVRLTLPVTPTGATTFAVDNISVITIPTVRPSDPGSLVVSWPLTEDYLLQSSTNLTASSWANVTSGISGWSMAASNSSKRLP